MHSMNTTGTGFEGDAPRWDLPEDDVERRFETAREHEQLGDWEAAVECYEQIMLLSPEKESPVWKRALKRLGRATAEAMVSKRGRRRG